MSRFKVFDTIDKLMKLYEADEEMGAEIGDAPAPEGGGDEGGEGNEAEGDEGNEEDTRPLTAPANAMGKDGFKRVQLSWERTIDSSIDKTIILAILVVTAFIVNSIILVIPLHESFVARHECTA